MNSEELELSLRTEFESHLKNVVADMRRDFSQFQEKVDAQFDDHKSQLDAVFLEFSARLGTERELEAGFSGTVIEHLRLARDEGSRISAMAFAQAEEMEKQSAATATVAAVVNAASPPTAGISELRDAINDITAQDSQATILKSLVNQAAQFTPRGAFFIVKNEHFVGWRVFGKESDSDEQAVREVFFPVASSTALGESVRSLSAVESSFGAYAEDSIYLDKLGFGQPDRMYAIPLIARGRGVAVLYADYGSQGEQVNIEALETLVRVAGLTVEVLAAAPAAMQDTQAVSPTYKESVSEKREEYVATEPEMPKHLQSVSDEQPEEPVESENFSTQPVSVSDDSSEKFNETEAIPVEAILVQEEEDEITEISVQADKANSWSQPTVVEEAEPETYQPVAAESDYIAPVENDYQFTKPTEVEYLPSETEETARFEKPSFEPVENFSAKDSLSNGKAESPEVETFEPVVKSEPVVTAQPVRSRFSDRNVDLPIEVGEDERRLHNDARRFARLLVSEIKLYNEQKVKEGRETQDLYERLRESIDRSRDMYNKRVQPPVAAKFDYFHYELVSSLAEGVEGKLGGNYPGAAI